MTVMFAPQGNPEHPDVQIIMVKDCVRMAWLHANFDHVFLDRRVVQTSERNYRPFDLRTLWVVGELIVSQRKPQILPRLGCGAAMLNGGADQCRTREARPDAHEVRILERGFWIVELFYIEVVWILFQGANQISGRVFEQKNSSRSLVGNVQKFPKMDS